MVFCSFVSLRSVFIVDTFCMRLGGVSACLFYIHWISNSRTLKPIGILAAHAFESLALDSFRFIKTVSEIVPLTSFQSIQKFSHPSAVLFYVVIRFVIVFIATEDELKRRQINRDVNNN